MYPDGRQISTVDLGELGGVTEATARYEGNTLTTYLRKEGELFMTAKRIMNPGNYISFLYVLKKTNFTCRKNTKKFNLYFIISLRNIVRIIVINKSKSVLKLIV